MAVSVFFLTYSSPVFPAQLLQLLRFCCFRLKEHFLRCFCGVILHTKALINDRYVKSNVPFAEVNDVSNQIVLPLCADCFPHRLYKPLANRELGLNPTCPTPCRLPHRFPCNTAMRPNCFGHVMSCCVKNAFVSDGPGSWTGLYFQSVWS